MQPVVLYTGLTSYVTSLIDANPDYSRFQANFARIQCLSWLKTLTIISAMILK
jgi:hypothetical protein